MKNGGEPQLTGTGPWTPPTTAAPAPPCTAFLADGVSWLLGFLFSRLRSRSTKVPFILAMISESVFAYWMRCKQRAKAEGSGLQSSSGLYVPASKMGAGIFPSPREGTGSTRRGPGQWKADGDFDRISRYMGMRHGQRDKEWSSG